MNKLNERRIYGRVGLLVFLLVTGFRVDLPNTLATDNALSGEPKPVNRADVVSQTSNAQNLTAAPLLAKPNKTAKPALILSGGIMDALDGKQRLAVGDTVIFRVLEDQEEPKALSITDAGELHVPELGLVTAAGKTCKELAIELKTKLEQTAYYRATVIIGIQLLNKTISGRRVYLAGQVRITGPQEIWDQTGTKLRHENPFSPS